MPLKQTFPLTDNLYHPVLASILQDRMPGVMVTGIAALHAGLTSFGLPGWSCPILHVFGVPCPGCGMTRGMVALVQGDWRGSLTWHAFAPIFLVALVILFLATFLPQKPRDWLIHRLELVERRTGVTAIVLIGLLVYWAGRLLIFPEAFINLIKG